MNTKARARIRIASLLALSFPFFLIAFFTIATPRCFFRI